MDEIYKLNKKSKKDLIIQADEKYIPKYRLDEVSKALKAQKQQNAKLQDLINEQANNYEKIIEELKLECVVLTLVARSKPLDFDLVLRFIKKDKLTLDTVEKSIKYQLRKIKKDYPNLFK